MDARHAYFDGLRGLSSDYKLLSTLVDVLMELRQLNHVLSKPQVQVNPKKTLDKT